MNAPKTAVTPTLGLGTTQTASAAPVARQSNEVAASTASAALRFTNITQYAAEFRIMQGSDIVARIGVTPGGEALVPVGDTYSVQASTTMGGFTLKSNTLQFNDASALLVAQVRMDQPGLYSFELIRAGAVNPNAIVLENTWREPVVFNVLVNGSPLAIVKVVDEHDSVEVSTVQQWDIYAIINGITTLAVRTNDPNAVLIAQSDNNDDGFKVAVS